VLSDRGKYKYATLQHTESFLSNKLVNIFTQTVVRVENVSNFVIVKTISGSAAAAAEAIDSLSFEGIAGTIAGDNTIFVLTRNPENAQEITQKMKRMLNS
jgi:transcriptional regulator of arginine metabolism